MTVHVEVEVANYYPSIASGISGRVYKLTQSWIHVLITHGFLRSLARLDLAESKVGRFAATSAVSAQLRRRTRPAPRRRRGSADGGHGMSRQRSRR